MAKSCSEDHAQSVPGHSLYTPQSCLDIDAKSVVFGSQTPGLNDTAIAKAVDEKHRRWSEQLPRESGGLWNAFTAFDPDCRDALFAHCIALSVKAVYEPWNRRPRALAHADRIGHCGKRLVAKCRQLPRPRDQGSHPASSARGQGRNRRSAQLIEHLKKGDTAERAQELLAASGSLPEPLRTPGRTTDATSSMSESSQLCGSGCG